MITSGSTAGGGQVALGVAVAACSAAFYCSGYILEKQALASLPALAPRPLPMIRTLARSPRWAVGFAAMLTGLVLQVLALTLAPVGVVQPVLSAGVLGVVVAGRAVLGERLQRRERVAIVLVLAAVATTVVSAGPGAQLARSAPADRFWVVVGLVVVLVTAIGRLVTRTTGRGRKGRRDAVALAVAAGLLYGVGALCEKAVATSLVGHGVLGGAVRALGTAYPWTFVAATLTGMVVFQAGLQRQPASLMVPLANVVSSGCAIIGASVVFGELLMPAGWWSLPRWLAFGAVLTAVAVLAVEEEPLPAPALA